MDLAAIRREMDLGVVSEVVDAVVDVDADEDDFVVATMGTVVVTVRIVAKVKVQMMALVLKMVAPKVNHRYFNDY